MNLNWIEMLDNMTLWSLTAHIGFDQFWRQLVPNTWQPWHDPGISGWTHTFNCCICVSVFALLSLLRRQFPILHAAASACCICICREYRLHGRLFLVHCRVVPPIRPYQTMVFYLDLLWRHSLALLSCVCHVFYHCCFRLHVFLVFVNSIEQEL